MANGGILHLLDIDHVVDVTVFINGTLGDNEAVGEDGGIGHDAQYIVITVNLQTVQDNSRDESILRTARRALRIHFFILRETPHNFPVKPIGQWSGIFQAGFRHAIIQFQDSLPLF